MMDERGQEPTTTNPTTTTTANLQLIPGTSVYDVNGHRLGTVNDPAMDNGALILREGHIFPKDVAIPLSAVASADASGVRLAVAKDDAQQQRWNPLATAPAVNPDIVMHGATVLDTGEQVEVRGTTVIERHPGAETRGTTVVDHDASEMTRGTTVRDTGAPHSHAESGGMQDVEAGK